MEVLSSMWHSLEQDPRLKGRPLIDSPVPVFSIIGTYLIFVLRVGPQMMRDRKPVNVKSFARVFNLYQVLISAWTVYTVCVCCYKLGIGYGEPPNTQRDPTTMRLINCLYIYLFVRISDLIDTVLFVLSGKQSHVSTLHVFHHVAVVFNMWLYLRQNWLYFALPGLVMNAGVHVIMYSYYLLATFPVMRPYLWWKKHLTLLQIVQFVCMLILMAGAFFIDVKYPPAALANTGGTVFIIMCMFVNFYVKNYINKARQQTQHQKSMKKN
ncbi:elongation of very long chain fatty acids protein 1-like isoform X1 [Varroa jacobsoni]|uniref:elongation of very long chain fatty acids protein 1-like isoform X1 n=1 Tax=Varroa jacobsoni TaxID=62625 RepID=UPI000BF8BA64|nr:elongation of very long chain fatty acids protein 1-like isoform X1 [Varroa jacobsoni]